MLYGIPRENQETLWSTKKFHGIPRGSMAYKEVLRNTSKLNRIPRSLYGTLSSAYGIPKDVYGIRSSMEYKEVFLDYQEANM